MKSWKLDVFETKVLSDFQNVWIIEIYEKVNYQIIYLLLLLLIFY